VRTTVRAPVAAGTFYPADPEDLRRTVDALLRASEGRTAERPWGIVVPHAGYRYSGPIAATAYGALDPWAAEVPRVLLLGPAHFVPLDGCAVPTADAWRTPQGEVPVDDDLRMLALAAGCVADDGPHEPEHSLEVQVPFLQRVVGERLRILPVAVGRADASAVAAILAGVPADLVVISTDLSHYLDQASARAVDRRTAEAVVARDPASIGPNEACGVFALRGAVAHAAAVGMPIRLLDLRTSGDTAGDADSVVGYGAFAIG
jgi:hypothetical protein